MQTECVALAPGMGQFAVTGKVEFGDALHPP